MRSGEIAAMAQDVLDFADALASAGSQFSGTTGSPHFLPFGVCFSGSYPLLRRGFTGMAAGQTGDASAGTGEGMLVSVVHGDDARRGVRAKEWQAVRPIPTGNLESSGVV